jgi:hypothetical protein
MQLEHAVKQRRRARPFLRYLRMIGLVGGERVSVHPRIHLEAHDATKANTRSGLPLPFSIFSGGQINTAPVGGNWSKLLRHCKP